MIRISGIILVIFLLLNINYYGYSGKVIGEPELVPLAKQILKDAEDLGYEVPNFYTLTLAFDDMKEVPDELGNTRLAYTQRYMMLIPKITMNRIFWNNADATTRYMVMLHEIGHGIWKRDHDDTILLDSYPKSIMISLIFNPEIFKEHRLYYLNELFGTCCTF